MYVTEKEASTKWCPFAMHSITADPRNRYGSDNNKCIGSRCMAWIKDNSRIADSYGFCGLARKS